MGFGGVVGIATMVAAVATATAVAVALCVPAASAVPMFSRENPLSRTGPRHDLDRSTGLEDVYEDAFREEDRPTSGTVLNETELDIIRRSIARSLGLKRIPDPSKVSLFPLFPLYSLSIAVSAFIGDRRIERLRRIKEALDRKGRMHAWKKVERIGRE